MNVLVLNCGSSSVKLQLIRVDDARSGTDDERDDHRLVRLARAAMTAIDAPRAGLEIDLDGRTQRGEAAVRGHDHAVRVLLERFLDAARSLAVDAVGHRVVHGGTRYFQPTIVDAALVESLRELEALAPLHNGPSVAGIRAARRVLGDHTPMVASFDTAFHHDLPEHAARYAIPSDLAERHGIRRFGFHGLSFRSVLARYCRLTDTPAARASLVILHLGSGCSAAAISNGRSVDTSMGFTPLEGLVMATRSGDLDPALVAFLAEREHVDPRTVEQWLNTRAGLLGVSGTSGDMRELLAREENDPAARLAIEMFCYRARKYVGAYLAAADGARAVVFTGGIGEHAAPIRARILGALDHLGVALDASRNDACVGVEGRITADGSALAAWVIPTDEEGVIARDTAACLAPR